MVGLIPAPYRLLAMAALLLLAVGGSYLKGRSDGRAVVNAKAARAMKKAMDELDRRRVVIDRVSGQLAVAQTAQSTETRVIYNESVRIVDRPIYRNRCVDGDGLRLLDRAAANSNAQLAGASAEPTPGASKDAP